MDVFSVVKINEDEAFVYFLKFMAFIEIIINHYKSPYPFWVWIDFVFKILFLFFANFYVTESVTAKIEKNLNFQLYIITLIDTASMM